MTNEKVEILKNRVLESIITTREDFEFSIQDICRMYIILSEVLYRQEVNPFGTLIPINTVFLEASNNPPKINLLDYIINKLFTKANVIKKAPSYKKQKGNVLILTIPQKPKPKDTYTYDKADDDIISPLQEREIDIVYEDSIEDIDDEEDK